MSWKLAELSNSRLKKEAKSSILHDVVFFCETRRFGTTGINLTILTTSPWVKAHCHEVHHSSRDLPETSDQTYTVHRPWQLFRWGTLSLLLCVLWVTTTRTNCVFFAQKETILVYACWVSSETFSNAPPRFFGDRSVDSTSLNLRSKNWSKLKSSCANLCRSNLKAVSADSSAVVKKGWKQRTVTKRSNFEEKHTYILKEHERTMK